MKPFLQSAWALPVLLGALWSPLAGRSCGAVEPAADRNYMGLGIAHAENNNAPFYADLMRTAREPGIYGDFNVRTSVDSEGWPTTDASIYVCDGAVVKGGHGTYLLRFKGQAEISAWFVDAVQNKVYDSATNTTTANLIVSNPNPNIVLNLRNTRLTPTSALGTGVRSIRLMRPISPGSNTPYSLDTLFTTNIQTIARKFAAIRAMDLRGTNSSGDVNWSDRTIHNHATYARKPKDANGNDLYGWQGMGVPWEHVIAFANTTNCDLWINVPAKANDDYIRKLAQLCRYGSDGVTPFTSAQSAPRWAPLNSNLKLYVEYSNELWNYANGFRQYFDNRDLVLAETNSPIRFDGTTDTTTLMWRRVAQRTVDISNIFRAVWGDGNMMSRVRPVFEWQYGNENNTASTAFEFMDSYYNNRAGNYVATPRPVSYYFWGGGAAGYYEPANNKSTTLTVDQILWESRVSNRPAQWRDKLIDIGWTSVYGLKRAAYEGGMSLGDDPSQSYAAKKAALADPRMKDVVIANQNTWSNYGGDLFMFFESSAGVGYGHTDDNFSTNTQKLQGVDALASSTRAPMTVGQAVPATVPGAAHAPNFDATGVLDSSFGPSGANYVLRAPSAGNYTLKINYNGWLNTNTLQILVNGQWLAPVSLPVTGSATGNTILGSRTTTVPLVAGKNGVRLALARGDCRIVSLEFSQGTTPSPTPTPTPAPTSGLQNGSFETPNIGGGNYSYNTANAIWNFAGNSGIQSNGSAWSAPNATDGTQTAFLQGQNGANGALSQSWNWNAGSYTVSFKAAQRLLNGQINTQNIRVFLDGTLITTITPNGTSFSTYTTPAFSVSAGNHTLKLEGGSSSGDQTAFLDQVSVASSGSGTTTTTLQNLSFETPNLGLGNYSYNTTGATWNFAGNSGIQNRAGVWTSLAPPDGNQTAFLQAIGTSQGAFSQGFSLESAASKTVSFKAVQRSGNAQTIRVFLNSTLVGSVTPSGGSWVTYSVGPFSVGAGSHTLKFQATTTSGDHTAFIDQVAMN